ncbi:MAG: thioredoxin [Planctomycetota bacterium]
MASENTKTFTADNFQDQVLNADGPVLVDFWAEWCQPCRLIGPIIDELADDYKHRASVGKVDVDSNASLASQYGVSSIPTVILFQNGEPVKRFIGLRSKADIAEALEATAVA